MHSYWMSTARSPGSAGGGGTGERRSRATATFRRGSHEQPGITAARQVAAEVCAALRSGELLDAAFERRVGVLDARDRRWTQELLWGMLRRRAWLDALLDARVRGGLARLDPDVTDLLRLGSYQLLFMGSVPAYAAIAQTVELAKRRHGLGGSKLANAVLRRVDRERDELDVLIPSDPVDALALVHSHPAWLVRRWVERWGVGDTEQLLRANNREAALTARPAGTTAEELAATLEGSGVRVSSAPLVPDSLRLAGAGSIPELGAFRQGLFYMQDPAATLVTRYAAIPEGSVVADLCAAPGGKALELARTARLVVASDRSYARLQRVLENVRRVDVGHVLPMVADARSPALREVDAVLVDAPCTGTGTFRRHPDARWRLQVSDLAVMAALQREILEGAATIVRPGGLLVYSTCSLEPEENEEQVEAFLATHPEWRLEPPGDGTVPDEVADDGLLRVLPQEHDTDGSFAARLRRSGAGE